MMKTIFKLMFSCLVLASCVCPVPAQQIEVPPAKVNEAEFNSIKDKLSISLFFRGELADKIIEADLAGRIIDLSRVTSHAQARSELLEWIKNDPGKAADLYFYLKSKDDERAVIPDRIDYKLPVWEMKDHFLEMVRDLGRSAKDASISEEEVSILAGRLFEGLPVPADAGILVQQATPRHGAAGGQTATGQLNFADHKLSSMAAEQENKTLGSWLESARSAHQGDAGRKFSGAEFKRNMEESATVLGTAFGLYQNFVVSLSGLKARKNITLAEARNIEALRWGIRKKLGALEALRTARLVYRILSDLRMTGAPGLLQDGRKIAAALEAFSCRVDVASGDWKLAAMEMDGLMRYAEVWIVRAQAARGLFELEGLIGSSGFSCFFDRAMFIFLERFVPDAAYPQQRREVQLAKRDVDTALGWILSGKVPTQAEQDGVFKSVEIVKARLETVKSYSAFNRHIQFLFWDIFANPLCLTLSPRGIAVSNPILGQADR